jgi:FkbM family methyltransferase
MNELTLRLHSGVSLVVPASLDSITTYILLEQEDWFEKEPAFLLRWLRPGMTVIDIGANLGAYGLPMARKVGPHGMVFAYEPGSEPRSLLERSRAINRADNLHVIAAAVSDRPREGQLVLGQSSELNSLEGAGPAENVWITALDAEDGLRGWSSIDFVKIDAEGEEERILDGGKSFFEGHSPLVMFEMKAGTASIASWPGRPCSFPSRPERRSTPTSSICSRPNPIVRPCWRAKGCWSIQCRTGLPMKARATGP